MPLHPVHTRYCCHSLSSQHCWVVAELGHQLFRDRGISGPSPPIPWHLPPLSRAKTFLSTKWGVDPRVLAPSPGFPQPPTSKAWGCCPWFHRNFQFQSLLLAVLPEPQPVNPFLWSPVPELCQTILPAHLPSGLAPSRV